ncbi:MAG TPA: GNAT family N-acetyltransferase [Pseudolysinimonas sp.]|nr:GNAT family N-acetyltransferase [Pseudolysinimonas sp.]
MPRVEELPVPESLDGAGGADFSATVEVRNAVESALYGTSDVAVPADEILVHWHDRHEPQRLWAVRADGRIVARGILGWQLGNAEVAWITIQVLPGHLGAGIGSALHEVLESEARGAGFGRMLAYAVHPEGPGERLMPPTGFGSVPSDNREVRFLLDRGWRLEQVERGSRIPLPLDAGLLAGRLAAAQDAAGPDYRVHTWAGPTPAEWLVDQAVLHTRMSTDAPSAGLEEPEDVWDAARVAEHEARLAEAPRMTLTATVEHLPTGRLVGYTQLAVPHDIRRPVSQEDTLVLREHRGHRLGMLLKAANLAHLEQVAPGHPGVLTWNAEENRPMLDVNESVGFEPIGYEGAWRKDLV